MAGLLGATPTVAVEAAIVTAALGVGYEWLAHHRPAAARRRVSVLVGVLAIATIVGAALPGLAASRR